MFNSTSDATIALVCLLDLDLHRLLTMVHAEGGLISKGNQRASGRPRPNQVYELAMRGGRGYAGWVVAVSKDSNRDAD